MMKIVNIVGFTVVKYRLARSTFDNAFGRSSRLFFNCMAHVQMFLKYELELR